MFLYELNNDQQDSGYVKIKLVLHEIFDNDNEYQQNGISWQEPYVSQNISSAIGKSIVAQFVDDDRVEIYGHGNTGLRNGILECADATVVGNITDAYVTEIEIQGVLKKVAMVDGQLDYYRYGAFIDNYREKYKQGRSLYGSVEVTGKKSNQNYIIYKDGYKQYGRVPTEYVYSAFALIDEDVTPADDSAMVVELNSKHKKETQEGENKEMEMKEMLAEISTLIDSKLEVLTNAYTTSKDTFELEANVEELKEQKAALEKVSAEKDEEISALKEELETCKSEKETLTLTIAEKEKVEEINSLDSAIKGFSEDEIACVKSEIESFRENPKECGYTIDGIVTKIKASAFDEIKKAGNVQELNSFNSDDMFYNFSLPDEKLESEDLTKGLFED